MSLRKSIGAVGIRRPVEELVAGWCRLLSWAGRESVSRLVVAAAIVLPGGATAADLGRAIPPGQEELLSRMLGRDAKLPGNCRFTGGGVEATVAFAHYDCAAGPVIVELRDVGDAPADAPRTQQFALVVRRGPAPSDLLEALATLVGEREAAFEWRQVSLLRRQVFGRRFDALALAGCAGLILLIALLAQYSVARGSPDAEPPAFGSRGRIVVLAEIFRRRQRPRDIRVVATLGLIAAFLVTRLSFLTRLPVYVDESVHIGWARDFFDAAFVAEFSVGRWLPVRLMSLFLLLPIDALFAARLGSVAMGVAVLVGCVLINRELFTSTEGLLAGLVYTLLPYALLYDRMALADMYVVAFGVWALYAAILAARRAGAAPVMILSVCTHAAILSKPTAGVFLLLPVLVNLFLVQAGKRAAYARRVAPTVVGGGVLLLFLVWAGYGTGLLEAQVAFEGSERLMQLLVANLAEAGRWFTGLLTPAIALAALFAAGGALVAGFVGAGAELLLTALLALAVLPFALISKTWYPSYLLFAVVPISLLLGRAVTVSVRVLSFGSVTLVRAGFVLATLLLVALTAPFDLALMMRPHQAPLPPIESSRYVTGGLSGYGLPELAAFLRAQAQAGPIDVVRFDLVQPPKHGLDVYLQPSAMIRLHSIDHRIERVAMLLATLANQGRTLFVSNPEAERSMGAAAVDRYQRAERIWSQERPGGETRLEVWEIQPAR
jgi:hypothetical protein